MPTPQPISGNVALFVVDMWPMSIEQEVKLSTLRCALGTQLGSSRSGTSPLCDFHSIKFRPADIPVWLAASLERLLRNPRPLRIRLRCQKLIDKLKVNGLSVSVMACSN